MGLAVATSLSKRTEWDIHILDLNPESGKKAASSLGATFYQSNVTDYNSLRSIFQTIFEKSNRLDFVFANAGIAEHVNFVEEQPDPPPEPKGLHALVDINLKSVISTSYLALHYMRKSPKGDKSLVMTASCGGIYPSFYSPIYTATKHGVVGLMRSIAPYFHHNVGIRTNAICPGTVKTNLLTSKEWENFPEEYFTPVEKIAEVVMTLVDGKDTGIGRGTVAGETDDSGGILNGKSVEVCGNMHYYRATPEYCDDAMRAVMGATNIEVLENATEI